MNFSKRALWLVTFLFFLLPTSCFALGYEQEPNDTIETATYIDLNTPFQGEKTYSSKMDYYKFTLPADGKVNVSIKNKVGSTWFVTVMDGKQKTYQYFASNSGVEVVDNNIDKTSVDLGLPAGTYYLLVNCDDQTLKVPYEIEVDFKKTDYYEKEFNDSMENATPILINKKYNGLIESEDCWSCAPSQDYFKFKIPADGNVTLTVKNKVGANWYFSVQDVKGKQIQYLPTLSGVEVEDNKLTYKKVNIGLPKGTYYILITGSDSSVDIPYQFEVDFKKSSYYEKEFNDSMETANKIKTNRTYNGTIEYHSSCWSCSSALDYYKFSVPQTGHVDLSLAKKKGHHWSGTLLNGKGEYIYHFDSNTGKKTIRLPKGTYYIQIVSGEGSATVPYKLIASYKVLWGKVLVEKSQVGKITAKSNVEQYQLSKSGKLTKKRTLSKGTEVNVYGTKRIKGTTYYKVGGSYYVKKSSRVNYKKIPSSISKIIKTYY
ncbi:SLAP domain-containing protein [Bacillus sp. 31A1R]|uniref:SLAP domain-containing protein n=1 Tax=Robertmurraya mangrovi TaxID=3098077 RepID=A0ABU5IXN5_9BACI|nr:SLAP domain-containing protein [Bacillus sp. 31A1R]MDZ5471865.1 SLAP domain-containing protein [Bacillus sp. 31A1R]